MTRRNRARAEHQIVVNLAAIPETNLAACARVLARIAVGKALKELGLDTGPTSGDNVGNQHKEAPFSASTPNEAKEQVV
jgi:hypothetical protein